MNDTSSGTECPQTYWKAGKVDDLSKVRFALEKTRKRSFKQLIYHGEKWEISSVSYSIYSTKQQRTGNSAIFQPYVYNGTSRFRTSNGRIKGRRRNERSFVQLAQWASFRKQNPRFQSCGSDNDSRATPACSFAVHHIHETVGNKFLGEN